MMAAFVQRLDHRPGELHGLGVDRVGALGGGDEAFLGGGAFDDLGVETLERLHLVAVAATGDRERRAGRREDAELGHDVLPVAAALWCGCLL